MVVDGFIFYNELDMLEFRLEEHDSFVDYFVIVEATVTHSGLPKELYFENNKQRFQKFLPKIVHVVVDHIPSDFEFEKDINWLEFLNKIYNVLKYPTDSSNKYWRLHLDRYVPNMIQGAKDRWQGWVREWMHRQGILKGLERLPLNDSDIVLISDVDEIIHVSLIEWVLAHTGPKNRILDFDGPLNELLSIRQESFYYNLECRGTSGPWYRPKIMNWGTLREIGDSDMVRIADVNSIGPGGWHFSYFGDVDQIIKKVQGFSHQEYNIPEYLDPSTIKQRIESFTDLFARDRDASEKLWRYTPFDKTGFDWPRKCELLIKLFNLPYTV